MNVTCPNCASMFRVDPGKIPEGGVRARCNICSAVFAVRREDDAQDRPAAVASGSAGAGARPMTSAAATPSVAVPSAPSPPAPPPSPPPPAPVMPRAEPVRPASPANPVTPAMPAAPARPSAPSPPLSSPGAPPRPASFPPPAVPMGAPRPAAPGGQGAPAAPAARPMGMPAAPPAPPTAPSPPAAAAPVTPPPPAPRPAPAVTGSRPVNPFLSQDPALKARRLARALISDMVVYHPTKRQDGLRDGNLKELFEEEIRKSWEEYADQVGKDVADSTPYFKEALNEILAGGRQIF